MQLSFVLDTLGRGQYLRLLLRDIAKNRLVDRVAPSQLGCGLIALAKFMTGLWLRAEGEVTAPRLQLAALAGIGRKDFGEYFFITGTGNVVFLFLIGIDKDESSIGPLC